MMGYRITYEGKDPQPSQAAFLTGKSLAMTGLALLLFGTAVYRFWPEGWQVLRTVLFPGDLEIALEAAQTFAASAAEGVPLTQAIGEFCRDIISHG